MKVVEASKDNPVFYVQYAYARISSLKRKAADVPLQANDILYIPDNKGKRSFARVMETVAAVGGGAAVASIYLAR